jgi:hypothetical protein
MTTEETQFQQDWPTIFKEDSGLAKAVQAYAFLYQRCPSDQAAYGLMFAAYRDWKKAREEKNATNS